jgi:IS30 family transposase
VVEPVDPFECRELDGLQRFPRSAPTDDLGLVKAVDGFGERVVIAVADSADGWFDASLNQAVGVFDRNILLGLKWSSQQLEGEVAMTRRRRRSDRSGRAPLFSPGRPVVAGRDEQRRFWAAIATGMASEDAALDAGMSQAVGTRLFRKAGGMPPVIFRPSAKPLSGRYLSFAEREEIALLHVQGCSGREVARQLGRAASTISRELRRNAATRSGGLAYRATTAQWHAERSARRPKQAKLVLNAALRTYVEERLAGAIVAPGGAHVPGPAVRWRGRRHGPRKLRRWASAWSPEQIARRLPVDFPDDETMRISPEAIYQALFVQSRGALRRELTACLRTGRALRVPRARTHGRGKTFISPEIMISKRPLEAADRAVPGHWEGDLIVGLGSSAIGTVVERKTRFTLLLHLPRMTDHGLEARVKNGPALAGHGAEAVCEAITQTITTLPEQLRRSLTWDQGAEMAQHARLKVDAGIQVYFCDPHSPWQRGTNENTNGLLRQYFPKGTDLSLHSADEIAAVAAALNARPRKTLAWKTPAEALDQLLMSAISNHSRN